MKKILLVSFFTALVFGAWAQERTVSGKVTSSEDGSAIPGVNVLLKGTAAGSVTDATGDYSLSVPESGGTLVFSFIGFVTQEIEIGSRSRVDLSMAPDVTQLTEVVVTALGIEREEKSLGYSVQEVSGEELSAVKSDNFINSLSGRVAGVQIKNNTNFGGSSNVLIRGASSLTKNNQPLYVIDGVPISNRNTNNTGQISGRNGYDYGNASSDINAFDIASISVLKGAAATALYGSKAANGVILITTKKGKSSAGKGIGVSLSSNVTFNKVDEETFPEYQTEYGAGYGPYYSGGVHPYLNESDVTGDGVADLWVPTTEDASRGERFDPGLMVYHYDAFFPESPYFGTPRPWINAPNGPITFFETGKSYSNSVEVNNATENASYRFSYTNMDQSGIMPNSSLKRDNFVFTSSYNVLKNLRVTAHANYIKTRGKGRPSTGYSDNIMSSFRQWFQTNVDLQEQKELFFNTGKNITWNPVSNEDLSPIYWDNPYWVRYRNFQTDERNRIIGYAQVDWELTSFLRIMGRASIDTYDQLQEERKAVGSGSGEFGVDRPDIGSGYSRFTQRWRETNADLIVTYEKDFGDIDLTAFVGANVYRRENDQVYASTSGGLAVPELYALSNSTDPMLPPEELLQQIGVNGLYGSVSLGFKDFLYLDATIRRDQSSTLPEANNSYYYPSVSTSFVFSELMDASWLSLGKVRLNYAEVGNDVTPLSVLDTYRANAPFSGNPLVTVFDSKNNPDLKPERSKSYEAGLQLNFLENRVGVDLSAYKINTFDQSLPLSVSQATGYLQKWINAGEIENKGIELALFGSPVVAGDFRWDIALNWAKNQNKVIYLYTDEAGNEVTNLQLDNNLQGGVQIVARKGEPYGTIIGSDYVYTNGQPTVGANGRYLLSQTNDNVIGNYNPDWTGGIRNSFRYKNFDFSFLIDTQQGGDVFSLDLWYGIGTGMYAETAGLNELGNPKRSLVAEGGGILNPGVYEDGSPNATRVEGDRYTADGWAVSPNARFVYDASYVKLREVVLTYNLPSDLLARTPVRAASLSFVGSNLWIISKNLPHADPEATQAGGNVQGWQSGVMPMTRNYGFTLNVKF
jgi:TonB-linked SusC/RagA family outer membrane protein